MKKKYSENTEIVEETVEEIVEPVVEETIEETVEDVVGPVTELVEGVVIPAKLNVRKEAKKTSTAVYILEKDATVMIDLSKSTNEFYKISTVDVEGYCVKEFIQVK